MHFSLHCGKREAKHSGFIINFKLCSSSTIKSSYAQVQLLPIHRIIVPMLSLLWWNLDSYSSFPFSSAFHLVSYATSIRINLLASFKVRSKVQYLWSSNSIIGHLFYIVGNRNSHLCFYNCSIKFCSLLLLSSVYFLLLYKVSVHLLQVNFIMKSRI